MNNHFMGWWHGPGGGWHGGPFFMILVWGLIILGIVYLVKLVAKSGEPQETALDILKKRYAAGELTRDEFEEMKKRITA